jgi:hypothetical protein
MTRTTLYLSLTDILCALFLCAPQSSPVFQGTGPGYDPAAAFNSTPSRNTGGASAENAG